MSLLLLDTHYTCSQDVAGALVRCEVYRVDGPGGPAANPRVRLLVPRAPTLDALLAETLPLASWQLAQAVAKGQVYQHQPWSGARDRRRFVLDPRPAEAPERAKVWVVGDGESDGSGQIERVDRRALVLALELYARAVLQPFEGWPHAAVKPWVRSLRRAHVDLLVASGGEALQPV